MNQCRRLPLMTLARLEIGDKVRTSENSYIVLNATRDDVLLFLLPEVDTEWSKVDSFEMEDYYVRLNLTGEGKFAFGAEIQANDIRIQKGDLNEFRVPRAWGNGRVTVKSLKLRLSEKAILKCTDEKGIENFYYVSKLDEDTNEITLLSLRKEEVSPEIRRVQEFFRDNHGFEIYCAEKLSSPKSIAQRLQENMSDHKEPNGNGAGGASDRYGIEEIEKKSPVSASELEQKQEEESEKQSYRAFIDGTEWISVWDPATARHYYYNKNTRKTTWAMPADISRGQAKKKEEQTRWYCKVCKAKQPHGMHAISDHCSNCKGKREDVDWLKSF